MLLRFDEFYEIAKACKDMHALLQLCNQKLKNVTLDCILDDEDYDEFENVFKGENFYVYTYKKGYGEFSFKCLVELFYKVPEEKKVNTIQQRIKQNIETIVTNNINQQFQEKLNQLNIIPTPNEPIHNTIATTTNSPTTTGDNIHTISYPNTIDNETLLSPETLTLNNDNQWEMDEQQWEIQQEDIEEIEEEIQEQQDDIQQYGIATDNEPGIMILS